MQGGPSDAVEANAAEKRSLRIVRGFPFTCGSPRILKMRDGPVSNEVEHSDQ